MANSIKLVIDFDCEDGKEHTFSFNHAKENTGIGTVKTLIQTMIENGSIYQNVPIKANSAKIVVTSESEYDID